MSAFVFYRVALAIVTYTSFGLLMVGAGLSFAPAFIGGIVLAVVALAAFLFIEA